MASRTGAATARDPLGAAVPEIAHELVALPSFGRLDWRCEPPLGGQGAAHFALGLSVPRDGATVRGAVRTGAAREQILRVDPGERVETPAATAPIQRLRLVHRHADETVVARVVVSFGFDDPAGDCLVRDLRVRQRAARP